MAQRRSLYGVSDTLWRQAKAAAAQQGFSLSEWIEEAIKEKLNSKKENTMTVIYNEDGTIEVDGILYSPESAPAHDKDGIPVERAE